MIVGLAGVLTMEIVVLVDATAAYLQGEGTAHPAPTPCPTAVLTGGTGRPRLMGIRWRRPELVPTVTNMLTAPGAHLAGLLLPGADVCADLFSRSSARR